jgi:hypothetical protein
VGQKCWVMGSSSSGVQIREVVSGNTKGTRTHQGQCKFRLRGRRRAGGSPVKACYGLRGSHLMRLHSAARKPRRCGPNPPVYAAVADQRHPAANPASVATSVYSCAHRPTLASRHDRDCRHVQGFERSEIALYCKLVSHLPAD